MPKSAMKQSRWNSRIGLVVGLGNPGSRYVETRHNVGFRVIDALIAAWSLRMRHPFFGSYLISRRDCASGRVAVVKPLTFMNRSGKVVSHLATRFGIPPEGVVLVCDNMDLPPGKIRIKRGGSTGGHRGIESVMESLGSGEFIRIYVGVGRPAPSVGVVPHVLGVPGREDAASITVAEVNARDALMALETTPVDRVINEYNSSPPPRVG